MEIVGSVESMVEWREEWGEESGIVGEKKGWGGTVGLKRGGKMVQFGNFYIISPCGLLRTNREKHRRCLSIARRQIVCWSAKKQQSVYVIS
nr:hypothetical protein [Tanacetum cinerariifolium]